MKLLIISFKKYLSLTIISLFLVIVMVGSQLIQPKLLEKVIKAITEENTASINSLGFLLIGIAVLGLIAGIINTIVAAKLSQEISADLRETTFRKIQTFSFSNIEKFSVGSIVVRLTNDITQVQNLIMLILQSLTRIPILFAGSLILAIMTIPRLWWIVILLIVMVVVILMTAFSFMGRYFSQLQKYLDKVNTISKENFIGIRVVKSFVQEKEQIKTFTHSSNTLMDYTLKIGYIFSILIPAFTLVSNLAVAATIFVAKNIAFDFPEESLQTLTAILPFIQYLMQIMMSIIIGGMLASFASRAFVSLARINEILDTKPDITYKNTETMHLTGTIEFRNVSFRYAPEEELTLKNISFKVNKGEMVGIVGATGAGKSTLVQLIPRLYDTTEGEILIDNQNIKDLSKQTLRQTISIVLQKAILFSGTIAENLRQGSKNATQSQMTHAAKIAQASEFIEQQELLYDAPIYERGNNFSGGQKQRLSITRGVIGNPKILILDDSTSALDARSEKLVKEALNHELKNTTTLIVAQKISSVVNADKILVLNEGELVAEGTHKELLKISPIYREIYETQKGQEVTA